MKGYGWVVGAAVVALLVARRLRGRRRRGHSRERTLPPAVARLGALLGETGLVAGREVRTRVRGRFFRVLTAVILLAIAAAIVLPVVTRGRAQALRVGVVGAPSAGLERAVRTAERSTRTRVRLVDEPDVAKMERDLRAGRLDVAVLGSREVLVDHATSSSVTTTTASLARSIATSLGIDRAIAAAGITPSQLAALSGARPVPIRGLQPGVRRGVVRASTLVGTIIVFIMLTQYLTWTLVGVMEEKSSRVVEVLLSAVRPVQLLGGKVLGIGTVALAQAGVILVFAIVLAKAVGSDVLKGTTPLLLTSTFVWLLLGYAFYSWVYAAAGSMAERQDQVQSLALPLSLPITFGYIVALTGASSGTPSALLTVLAYLPPTAPFAMPVLVGLGAVAWWQFLASCLVSLVCTVGIARAAAVVYRRAVLRTGRRVPLRELVSAAR